MKIAGDYKAKLRLWAANPKVVPLPPSPPLPRFRCQRFKSHEEMNRWKEDYLRRIAQQS